MKILSVENLSRSFGGIKANDNISFEVEQGSILGIIGLIERENQLYLI